MFVWPWPSGAASPPAYLLGFPLGWSAIGPAEGPCGAVPEAIPDSDWGSEGEFEIGRFGAPKGRYFEIACLGFFTWGGGVLGLPVQLVQTDRLVKPLQDSFPLIRKRKALARRKLPHNVRG